jgi:CheY-like chemotaxis protein
MLASGGEPNSRSSRTVDCLVVDDYEEIRRSISELLREEGYSVIEASDGSTALRVIQQTHVRSILLDLRMPGGSGLALLDAVDDPPPIIITSAYALSPEEQRRVDEKIFVCLVKPIPPRRLISAIASAIGPPSSDADGARSDLGESDDARVDPTRTT